MTPAEATGQWVENFVIRHGLCPFAARPFRAGLTETITCAEEGIEACFIFAITQVQGFLDKKQAEVETTLLVFASSLTDFGEFLDFVATLEDALEEVGANELIQLAHFHPDYQFADVPANDSGNLTNRSPFRWYSCYG